jgi:hypothetical protein
VDNPTVIMPEHNWEDCLGNQKRSSEIDCINTIEVIHIDILGLDSRFPGDAGAVD